MVPGSVSPVAVIARSVAVGVRARGATARVRRRDARDAGPAGGAMSRSTAATRSAGSVSGEVGWRRTSVAERRRRPPDRVQGVERDVDRRRVVRRERRGPVERPRHPMPRRPRRWPGRRWCRRRGAARRPDPRPRAAADPRRPADERDAADEPQVLARHPPAAAAGRDEEQDRAGHGSHASRSVGDPLAREPGSKCASRNAARASGRSARLGDRGRARPGGRRRQRPGARHRPST